MSAAEKIAQAQAILARDIGPQRKLELVAEVLGPGEIMPAPSNVGAPPEPAKADEPKARGRRAAARPDGEAKAEGADAEIEKAPPEGA